MSTDNFVTLQQDTKADCEVQIKGAGNHLNLLNTLLLGFTTFKSLLMILQAALCKSESFASSGTLAGH